MELCIHRGARQIGGTCLEITCAEKRLLIDLGLPLDAALSETPLPPVAGLESAAPDLLGIVISHAHMDHYGLIGKVHPDIPVLIGDDARRIIAAARVFFPDTVALENTLPLENQIPISLGPFTITPYLVDHSAYDAYALLVEACGKRIFYSGDFRAHGRKSLLFERLVQTPPAGIDALFMEGATIGRTGTDAAYPTEDALEIAFKNHFSAATGLTLVWTSGQNIDRLVTIYKACRRAGKKFITDLYTANILKSIGNDRLPQPGWKDFLVFVPRRLRIIIKARALFDFIAQFSRCRIYPEQIKAMGAGAVMLFRPSMADELENAGCIDGAALIYSLWSGYLKEDRMQWVRDWLDRNRIPLHHCHTSGHASVADLQRFAAALKPAALVPIHSFEPGRYPELFDNVTPHEDGERWIL